MSSATSNVQGFPASTHANCISGLLGVLRLATAHDCHNEPDSKPKAPGGRNGGAKTPGADEAFIDRQCALSPLCVTPESHLCLRRPIFRQLPTLSLVPPPTDSSNTQSTLQRASPLIFFSFAAATPAATWSTRRKACWTSAAAACRLQLARRACEAPACDPVQPSVLDS